MEAPQLDLEAIEDLIRQSMSAAKAQGIAIEPGALCTSHNGQVTQVCAIGSLSIPYPRVDSAFAAARFLRQPDGLVYGVIDGFDGTDTYGSDRWVYEHRGAYEQGSSIGQRLRAEVDAGLWRSGP